MGLADPEWFKSSRSGSQSACVEVAARDAAVGVRDSKDRGGPVLGVAGPSWRLFVADVKSGDYDR